MTQTARRSVPPPLPPRAILMPTCHKHTRLADLAARTTMALWPGHPPLWIVTDRGELEHPNVVRSDHRAWVPVMRDGLSELVRRGVLTPRDWIVLVLEDHAPNGPVPADAIAQALGVAESRGAHYVRLHHGWKSAVRWLAHIAGHALTVNDPARRFYHSLHPAGWRVDHLARALDRALQQGVVSPWGFETLPYDGCEHLALDDAWPSRFGGFLVRGHVDLSAAFGLRHPATHALRSALMIRWLRDMVSRAPRGLLRRSLRALRRD